MQVNSQRFLPIWTLVLAGVLTTYFLVRTASTLLTGYTVPFTFPLPLIVAALPLMMAIAALAAWWPARRAVELSVVEAIGYE